jgi:hypothetical protein
MIRCTRSVCLASSGRLVDAGRVSCGAGLRVEALSSAQPVGSPTRIKMAIVRRHLMVSPSSAQAPPMVNRLSVIAQESSHLESLSVEKSPLDSHVIAIPKRPKTIHV